MSVKQKATGRASALPLGIAIGVLIALLITLGGSAFLAYLIYKETIPENAVGTGSAVILLLSAAAGAIAANRKVKRKFIQVSLMTGAGYFLNLIALNALIFGGQYAGVGMTALLVGAATSAVAIWIIRREMTPKFRRKIVGHG